MRLSPSIETTKRSADRDPAKCSVGLNARSRDASGIFAKASAAHSDPQLGTNTIANMKNKKHFLYRTIGPGPKLLLRMLLLLLGCLLFPSSNLRAEYLGPVPYYTDSTSGTSANRMAADGKTFTVGLAF